MINFKLWFKAIRVPFFTATIIPAMLGSVVAWYDTSNFSWFRFCLAMVGALFIHAGTNLANDYYDHLSGCDKANPNPTPFSGGSRVIQDGLITPRKILCVSLTSFFMGGIAGLYLNHISRGNVILAIGLIGVFLSFFYTAKPLRIGYGNFGELAVAIGFGPLIVSGAYYVQTQNLPVRIIFLSIPIGILIALVLFINEFPDYAADKKVHKRTLVVVLGKRRALALYQILLGAVYMLVTAFVIFKILPAPCLIVFFSLPLALKAFVISRRNFDKIYELLPANAATIGLHSLIGLLLCGGILLGRIL